MPPRTAGLPEPWHASEQSLSAEVSEESNHERGGKGYFSGFLLFYSLFLHKGEL